MTKKTTILTATLVMAGIVVSIGAIASTQTGMIKKKVKTLSPEKSQNQSATGSREMVIGSQGGTVANAGEVVIGSQGGTVAVRPGTSVIGSQGGTTVIVLDTTPVGELTRFENNLKDILGALQGTTGAVVNLTNELHRTLQSDWNKLIEKHTKEVLAKSGGAISITKDAQYIQAKQRVEGTLKATIDAINKELKK